MQQPPDLPLDAAETGSGRPMPRLGDAEAYRQNFACMMDCELLALAPQGSNLSHEALLELLKELARRGLTQADVMHHKQELERRGIAFSSGDRYAACPMCDSTEEMGAGAQLVYGQFVCRQCYYGFANRRQLAFLIDAAVFCVFLYLLLLGQVAAMRWMASTTVWSAVLFAYLLFYFLKDGFHGHSLGKYLLGLQVIDRESGQPAGFWPSFNRNLSLAIPLAPFLIGLQLQGGARLGDDWAHTCVVWKKYSSRMPFSTLLVPTREPVKVMRAANYY